MKLVGYIIVIAVIALNVLLFLIGVDLIDSLEYEIRYTLGMSDTLVTVIYGVIIFVSALFEMVSGLILIAFSNLCNDVSSIRSKLKKLTEKGEKDPQVN